MVLLFASLAGCRTDEPVPPAGEAQTTTLRLNVVPQWGDLPFERFAEYRAPGDYRFKVELLKLYLSELRLVNGDGEQRVSDVQLLDLGNGPFAIDLRVPPGTWYGLRAGLGLPPAVNHADPSPYPNGHPLGVNTGMTWNWATGYKFVLFDGRYDADPTSTSPLISGFSVHTGMDTCFTTLQLFPAEPFETIESGVTQRTLRIQVDGFLNTLGDVVDVTVENSSHGGNLPLALKITRNVSRSIRLE